MKVKSKPKITPKVFDKTYYSTGNYEAYREIADQWIGVVARRISRMDFFWRDFRTWVVVSSA